MKTTKIGAKYLPGGAEEQVVILQLTKQDTLNHKLDAIRLSSALSSLPCGTIEEFIARYVEEYVDSMARSVTNRISSAIAKKKPGIMDTV
jgi:hypothetical protein